MNGKRHCEKLMNALLPLAEKMLKQYKEFYPYGGYMKPNGEIVQVGAEDEETDRSLGQHGNVTHGRKDSGRELAVRCR